MSSVDTRARYRKALEIIARGETDNPEEVAQEAVFRQAPLRMLRNMIVVGDRFGRLEAIYSIGHVKVSGKAGTRRPKYADLMWLCWCDCGNFTVCRTSSLTHNQKRSCGCYRDEIASTAALRGSCSPAFRRGSHFPDRVERAMNKLRRSARIRSFNKKRGRENEARKLLEETRRKLIPYAGYDKTGTRPPPVGEFQWSKEFRNV